MDQPRPRLQAAFSGLVVPLTISASKDKIQALKSGPRPHLCILTQLKSGELGKVGGRMVKVEQALRSNWRKLDQHL